MYTSNHDEPWAIQKDDPRVNDLGNPTVQIGEWIYEVDTYSDMMADGSRIATLKLKEKAEVPF